MAPLHRPGTINIPGTLRPLEKALGQQPTAGQAVVWGLRCWLRTQRKDDPLRPLTQPLVAVAACSAPTGLDSGEPRCRSVGDEEHGLAEKTAVRQPPTVARACPSL